MLAWVHRDILWMDRPVAVNVDLIATITWLPTDGKKPKKYMEVKNKEKSMSNEINSKYGMKRGNRGIKIKNINYTTIGSATRLLC